jgi:hypothetical protein
MSRMMGLASMLALALAVPSLNASAAVGVELCANLDGSGSIMPADFSLQKQGLSAAVADPTVVPQNGTVALAVVQFASSARVEVQLTVIDSAATAASLAAQIDSIAQMRGGTSTDLGINTCTSVLAKTPSIKSVIDTSTDGVPNSILATAAAADAAIAAGVDELNSIGVGAGVNVTGLEASTRPLPATEAPPYDPGFYIIATDFVAYQDAIKEKVRQETGGGDAVVAVPAIGGIGIAVLVSLLAGLGARGLRRTQRQRPRA